MAKRATFKPRGTIDLACAGNRTEAVEAEFYFALALHRTPKAKGQRIYSVTHVASGRALAQNLTLDMARKLLDDWGAVDWDRLLRADDFDPQMIDLRSAIKDAKRRSERDGGAIIYE